MHVISQKNIKDHWGLPGRGDSEGPLTVWLETMRKKDFSSFADVKAVFGAADWIPPHRVVFNIGGNKYRLIAAMNFSRKKVWVKFIGTHAEYDKIDASTINQFQSVT